MNQSPISGRMVAVLVGVCALAMLALAVLYAFAPDLRDTQSSQANALSRSAVGFAGLIELLDDSGMPARIDRGVPGDRIPSLVILTPPAFLEGRELAAYRARSPVLIVMDKWLVAGLRTHPGWVSKFTAMPADLLQKQIASVAITATLLRAKGVAQGLATAPGKIAAKNLVPPKLGRIEQLQTILGRSVPLLTVPGQGALLSGARVLKSPVTGRNLPVYILSDPDLLNNHGLADPDNARAAVAIIAALRRGNGPVAFDITLNGLGKSPNLFRAAFAPPFLGATLCALLAALLMGLHTAFRFGAPLIPPRIFARGKTALADNSAQLVRMMGREGAMAPRYVLASRTLVLDAVSARRASPAQQQALLDTLSRGGDSYESLAAEAAGANSGNDLLSVARKTFDWRRRISGGH